MDRPPLTEDELVREQIEYYRARAPEYDRTSTPSDDALAPYGAALVEALDRFAPTGAVLEIASGTGGWTARLLDDADSVTALDASPEMHQLARTKIEAGAQARSIVADVFTWEPDSRYDVVFFANRLSHVPPSLFGTFWDTVAAALRPDGRVFLIDETADVWRYEYMAEGFAEGGAVPLVRRTLLDGRVFTVVKVFWDPHELEAALRSLGWISDVHVAGPFFWASARRA